MYFLRLTKTAQMAVSEILPPQSDDRQGTVLTVSDPVIFEITEKQYTFAEWKLTAKKKKPSETLTGRFRELAVIISIVFSVVVCTVFQGA